MAIATVGPVPKDVVIATLGASAVLAGLVLVFAGMMLSSVQGLVRTFLAETAKSGVAVGDEIPASSEGVEAALLLQPGGLAGRAIVILAGAFLALLISLATVGVGLAWLAVPGGHGLYHVEIWLFVAELLAIVFLAAATIDLSLRSTTLIARH